jgi:hypothetical protein
MIGQASSSDDACTVVSTSAPAARRLEPAALAEDRAGRPADEAARDDAADRDGDCDRRGARDARLFEQRCEGEAGRGPAGQRDRAGEHAEQRVQPEAQRNHDADHVLQHCEDGRQQEKTQYLRSADLQQRQARAEPDRREERDHERALQRRVEGDQRRALAARDQHRDGDEEPAKHWCRQVVATEDRYQAAQALAEQQRHARKGEGLDEI